MVHGLDTSFLIAAELAEHSGHAAARRILAQLSAAGDLIAIAPQVLAEFLHVVTDQRRLENPLTMDQARRVAQQWWTASDVRQAFPSEAATSQFLMWIQQFSLGRKRLLDTLLSATYHHAGIQSILTTNPADFAVFGVFSCITPEN
ncbi:MAG: type II toxin-antitoxin system VapC family toxin [Planctomycetia bacterium]|nr:type II toxin-antitoxin system VapC family toxin [Planctomycetia bacterium]